MNINIRIVSLSPAITEMICHLGGEKNLAGRSSACDYPEGVKKLPVAGDFAKPYMEKIFLLRPHYLLTNDLINPVAAKRFESVGIKCVMKQITSVEDYFFWVNYIGKILKKENAASLEIRRVKKMLAELKKNNPPERKKILWVIWDSPVMVAGKNSLPHYVIKCAGGENAAGKITADYFRASAEYLVETNPDHIVFLGLSARKQRELGKKYPWNSMKAWKEGKIITHLPEELLFRPGPRLFNGISLFHKEIFPEKK